MDGWNRSILRAALLAALCVPGIRAAPGGLWLEETFDLETEGAFGDRTDVDLAFARSVLGQNQPFIASPLFVRYPHFAAPTLSCEHARSGRWSLRFFVRGEPMRAEIDPGSRRGAVAGASLVLLARVASREAQASVARIGVEWFRDAGDPSHESDLQIVSLGNQRGSPCTLRGTQPWQPIRCDARAPEGATSFVASIEVRPEDPAARGGSVFFDDIVLRWVPSLSVASIPGARFLEHGQMIGWRIASLPLPSEILRAPVRRVGERKIDPEIPEKLRRVWREEGGERDANRRTVTLRLLGPDGDDMDRLEIAGSIVSEDPLAWEGTFPGKAPEAGHYTVLAELRTKWGGEDPVTATAAGIVWLPEEESSFRGSGLTLVCGWPADLPVPEGAVRILPGPILADLSGPGAEAPAWTLKAVARLALRVRATALGDPAVAQIARRSEVAILRGPVPDEASLAALARVPIVMAESEAGEFTPIRGMRAARILVGSFRGPGGAGRLARAIAECSAAGIDVAILEDPDVLIERSADGVGPRSAFVAWTTIGAALAGRISGTWPLDPRGAFLRIPRQQGEAIVAWSRAEPFRIRYTSSSPLQRTDALGRTKALPAEDGVVDVEVGPEPILLAGMSGAREATLGSIRVAAPLAPHGRWQPIAFDVENRADETIALRAQAHCALAEVRLDRREIALRPGERGRIEGRIRLSPAVERQVPVLLDVETPGEKGSTRIVAAASLSAAPFEIEGPDWVGAGAAPGGAVRVRNLAAERVRAHIHISIDGKTALRSEGRPLAPGEACTLTFRVPPQGDGAAGALRIGVVREGDAAFATKTVPLPALNGLP
ncbi:MAG: hypothetical protein JXP34_20285 [Planctomycetes bacterium]|nr:hypothetical protein [Planctomycetota bacterium]